MTAPLQLRDYACAKVRRRLDSYLAGELSVDVSHEILEHLDRCPECRAESDAREKLRASFRRVAGETPGPRDGFEDEVRALLLRTPLERSMGRGLLLAASLILGAGVTGWLVLSRATAPEASRAADDVAVLDASAAEFAALNHKNCTRAGSWPREAASAEAFTGHVDAGLAAAARAAAARLPGYAPVSAHECAPAGERIFHIIFRRPSDESPDGLVSVVVTRPGSALAAHVAATARLGASRRLGYAVVGARAADGKLVLVVSSASEKETVEMGRAVLPALATAIAVP